MTKWPLLTMLTGILFLIFLAVTDRPLHAAPPAQAPDSCGCDHTVPLDRWKTDAAAEGIQPGETVCLGTGTRGNMRLENFEGTAAQPITIQNCGGQLVIDTDSYGISVARSKHIRLTGTGSADHRYGIDVSGTVGVGGLSSNVEVDHLEIHDAGFAGMMVKTDPNCDPATWRENFTMYDVSLHDNYIHHTGDGEGFYVGFTFYDGYEVTCDGQPTTVYGHIIDGLEMYNNITEDTGAEGIQVSSIPNGAAIYNNTVLKYGQRPFADYQNNGIQIGEGNARIYNNLIQEGPGNGLIIFGTGHRVFNNIIIGAGAHAIFADDRRVGLGHAYLNNTLISPAEDGLRIYTDEATTINIVKNNLIVNPGGDYVVPLNGVELDMSHNLFEADLAAVQFKDEAAGNYRPAAGSPAIDSGTDVSALGVTMDYAGTPRPQDGAYDIGAYEFTPALTMQVRPNDQALYLTWQVDITLPLTSTWRLAYEGPPGDQPSPLTGLSQPTRAYTLTGLTNYAPYTLTLQAMLDGSPFLTDTVTATPTDLFIYLPVMLKGE